MVSTSDRIFPFFHQCLCMVALLGNDLVGVATKWQPLRNLLPMLLRQHVKDNVASLLNISLLLVVPLFVRSPRITHGRCVALIHSRRSLKSSAGIQESGAEIPGLDTDDIAAEWC